MLEFCRRGLLLPVEEHQPAVQVVGYSSQSFAYNNLWQLTGISANPALISMQYVYPAGHNNGRISQSIDGVLGQTVNYTYDSLNRLSTAQATNGAWGQSYSYDGFGNLTAKTVTAGSAQQFNAAYSAATNQQVGGWYDANGNSLYGPYDPNGYRYQYYYDVENRLVGVGSSDGSPGYGYGYDPQGKRVMVETALTGGTYPATNATFTLYGITGQRLTTFWVTWSQYSNSGYCNGATYCSGTLTNYLYLAGKRLAQPDGYAFLADRLGSQRENGQAYYPWGEPMGSAQTGDVEFATYWRDMVGQDYADQRYYNSNAGRFYTPDPKGMRAVNFRNPTSWNMYAYVSDDPTNNNDPTGLCLIDGQEYPDPCFSVTGTAQAPLPPPDNFGTWSVEYNCIFFQVGCLTAIYNAAAALAAAEAATSAPQGGLQQQRPPEIDCVGVGRGLSGNPNLVGKQGGIPGQTVQLGTAAVIPQQFGLSSGAALAQYAPYIFGTIGQASFSGVTDVIGGASPVRGMPVRQALPFLYPGQLILEIPGASDQGSNAPVNIYVPQALGCPTGTTLVGR